MGSQEKLENAGRILTWRLRGATALPHLGFGFLASGTVREYNSVISSHQVWGPVLRSPEETHDKCRQNTSRGQSGNIWKTYAPSLSMHDFPPRNYSELRVEDLSEISRIFTEAFFQGNEEKNLHVQ